MTITLAVLLGFGNRRRNGLSVGHVDGATQGMRQVQRRHPVYTTRQQQQRVTAFRQQFSGGKANTGAGTGYHD